MPHFYSAPPPAAVLLRPLHPPPRRLLHTRNAIPVRSEPCQAATYLIHDRDTKFTAQFDAMLEAEGITVKEPTAKSPNMNAFAERWAQTVQVECLDHFVVLGEDHLRYLVSEYVDYFNAERPHQAMDNRPLTATPETTAPADGEILCRERLGGLLRHYYRQAA